MIVQRFNDVNQYRGAVKSFHPGILTIFRESRDLIKLEGSY